MDEILKISAFAILLFVTLLLLVKKKKGNGDLVLLPWCLIMGFHLITINFTTHLPAGWFWLNDLLGYTHGLFLYIYLRRTVTPDSSDLRWHYHLGGLLFGYLLITPILFRFFAYDPLPGLLLKFVFNGAYVFMSGLLLSRHPENRNYWQIFLVIGLAVLMLFPLVSVFVDPDYFIQSRNEIGNLAYCIFILLLGFAGIGLESVFVGKEVEIKEVSPLKVPRYATSTLNEKERETIFVQLEERMNDESMFLNPSLTIRQMSEKTGYSANKLSESINLVTGHNFNDYVNLKRLDRFKTLIAQDEHQSKTLLALAFECGFNSKTSFNRAFKKHNGLTPSEYVRTK